MIQRLGIFCFYDKEGIVDTYVEYLLGDICNVLKKLIVVINGNLNEHGRQLLEKYADSIVIRENTGFDGGAYADIIVNFIGENEFTQWDEVVLFNDTFYGPFIHFSDIFQDMSSKNIDFWGLNYFENGFLTYIESYFLVFRKKIIQNGKLYFYLANKVDIKKNDIIYYYAIYEHGLFSFLVDQGYSFDSYSKSNNFNTYSSAHICIEKNNLPILKKKSFDSQYYNLDRQIYVLQYIKKNSFYNIDFIIENVQRLYGFNVIKDTIQKYEITSNKISGEKVHKTSKTRAEIKKYFQSDELIYIYGAGMYAKFLWYGYNELIKNFGGFVISDGENVNNKMLYGYPVKEYSQLEGKYKIIVGLSYKNSLLIRNVLKNEKNMLFLWENV